MKINYNFKEEHNPEDFTSFNGKISLREYEDSLIFYSPLNSDKAEYCVGDKKAKYTTEPSYPSGGPFGTYLKLSGDFGFDGANTESLNNEGRISFYAGIDNIEGYPSIALTNSKFPSSGLPAGTYSLNVTIDGQGTSSLVVTVSEGCSFSTLKNKILFMLDPDTVKLNHYEVDNTSTDASKIIFQSSYQGRNISIADGTTDNNLLDYLEVEGIDYGTYPSSNTTIFKVGNIIVRHLNVVDKNKSKSYLGITIGGNEGSENFQIPWNNNGIDLDNIEIDFDSMLMYVFINGKLKAVNILNYRHTGCREDLCFGASSKNIYKFDEIIINSKVIHRQEFEPSLTQLTKYTRSRPYIDYNFSGSDIKKGMKLYQETSNNIHMLINDDNHYYYYYAGGWRDSDGTFYKSNDSYTFEDALTRFPFSGKDFFIRAFFYSNGTDASYIEDICFQIDDDELEDQFGNTPAIIIGSKKFSFSVDPGSSGDSSGSSSSLDSTDSSGSSSEDDKQFSVSTEIKYIDETVNLYNKFLKIETDKGTTEINFSDSIKKNILKQYIYFDSDDNVFYLDSNYTQKINILPEQRKLIKKDENGIYIFMEDLEGKLMMNVYQIIEFIESYYPEGISKVFKDELGRVNLISETKGKEGYIRISGTAVPIIFENPIYYEAQSATQDTIDYTKFFEAVRNYGGKPVMSWEITETQMKLYLREALEYYKRWKADDCNEYMCHLKGNYRDGYEIPSVIENKSDVIDIIFRPVFPITFYGSDLLEGDDDIITLTLANSLIGGGNFGLGTDSHFTQDYYISLVNIQDFKQTLGLNPTWEIMNGRIFIYPSNVTRFTTVSIKYKSPISEEDALKDPDFIKYVCGKCWMMMGQDRGQYGSSLSAGNNPLIFNGDALWERGKAYVDEVLLYWKSCSRAMGFLIG